MSSFKGNLGWMSAVCCAWMIAVAAWALAPAATLAQDDLDAAKAAGKAEAAPAKAAPAGGATEAAADAPQVEEESVLMFYYISLGLKYVIIFLALSFIFVALLVMNFLAVRRDSIVPAALVEAFEAHLNEKRFQEAYDLAKSDDSFLGHVLAAGMGILSAGYGAATEAMQEVGEDEAMRLEQRLSYIALIGTLAPMFGLLGTVDGMVASFQVIAKSTTQPKPSELASGISQALITTLVGLWLAIPAIAAFGYMKNRVSRLVFEAGVLSDGLMGRFAKK